VLVGVLYFESGKLQEIQGCMKVLYPVEMATVFVYAALGCLAYCRTAYGQLITLDEQLLMISDVECTLFIAPDQSLR
jgi:hypothetical protein